MGQPGDVPVELVFLFRPDFPACGWRRVGFFLSGQGRQTGRNKPDQENAGHDNGAGKDGSFHQSPDGNRGQTGIARVNPPSGSGKGCSGQIAATGVFSGQSETARWRFQSKFSVVAGNGTPLMLRAPPNWRQTALPARSVAWMARRRPMPPLFKASQRHRKRQSLPPRQNGRASGSRFPRLRRRRPRQARRPGGTPPSRPGQIEPEQAKHEARAKILWGDKPEAVLGYLLMQGSTGKRHPTWSRSCFGNGWQL